MNTLFELRKDGTTWVFHSTPGGQTKDDHPIEQPCQWCPAEVRRRHGKRTAERLPDVRDEGE